MESVRVLLVEDDGVDAAAVHRALSKSIRQEYHVETVSRLSEAFDKLYGADFDIILLDLGLPDSHELSGLYNLVSRLDVPVVVLTGNNDPELAERAIAIGAHDYVPKSENLSTVLDRTLQFAIQRCNSQRALFRTESLLSAQHEFARLRTSRVQRKLTIANRLASLAEHSDRCVAMLNSECNVEWANNAFKRNCEVGFQDLSLPPLNILSVKTDVDWLNAVRSSVKDVQPCKLCWTVRTEQGLEKCFLVELLVISRGEDSTSPRFMFSFIQEVTNSDLPLKPQLKTNSSQSVPVSVG